MLVPNIVNFNYGRKIGHTLEEEVFEESVTETGGTEIRQKLRVEGK